MLKPVEEMTPPELFDAITGCSYNGMIFRAVLWQSDRAKQAAQTLVAELRQDPTLQALMEKDFAA